ncbi:MAG TPA: OPT/YSL family transporter [Terriglobia bacterium]|nr:OPT/YSL family transporter [Terriglobia bacterium]
MGCLFGVGLIMIKAPSPMLVAVGMYLPLETTGAIFVGGVIKWLADSYAKRHNLNAEDQAKFEERGTLLASGFIAGEAITGILLAVLFIEGIPSLTHVVTGQDVFGFVANWGGWISLAAFALVAFCLIRLPLRSTRGPVPRWLNEWVQAFGRSELEEAIKSLLKRWFGW